jgi:alpha-tubulin suppressor-like RCC1 family protein
VTSLEDEDIISINAVGDVSAAVTAKGEIYTWGKTKVLIKTRA